MHAAQVHTPRTHARTQEVAEAFEGTYGKEVANEEEARALIALGFTLLDVRSQAQVDAVGKPRAAVHVPYLLSTKRYDTEQVRGYERGWDGRGERGVGAGGQGEEGPPGGEGEGSLSRVWCIARHLLNRDPEIMPSLLAP